MHAILSRRGIAAVAAVVAVAGSAALGAAGVANAATVGRPTSTLGIGAAFLTGADWEVFCTLTNASNGAAINGAVVELDRDGSLDHKGSTSEGGVFASTVRVASGTSATFQCIFPGNNSFVSSQSGRIKIQD